MDKRLSKRCLLGFLLALSLPAQHDQNSSKPNPAIGDPKAIAVGVGLYANSCAGCHGPDGAGGRGPNLVRRTLWHPLNDEAIFRTIRNGVPGADMPPTPLSDEQTWDLVAFLHALIGPANENKVPGDAEGGGTLFWGAKAGCSQCHSIRGQGGRMAPDLTNIGARPLALIKESIVEHSKGLSLLGQEAVVVTLKNRQVIRGVARNRNNYSLQVVDQKGALHLISMIDVTELSISETSAMPGDYAKRLSEQELRGLLAYLAQQSLRPPGTGNKQEAK